jgi:hypothetical protein
MQKTVSRNQSEISQITHAVVSLAYNYLRNCYQEIRTAIWNVNVYYIV